jgi:serine/threonine-protein kinase RsbW
MTYQDSSLEIEIEDQGEGFDPKKVENPLLPENLLKATGRGIFYMNNFMDSVSFEFKKKKNGTILRMKKTLQSA